ncbi:DUF4998 domain-containing protein [Zunongwangia atlantica]|uniref:PDK repeat-containing protein n=1 Tax=Zunongwangia atlantica 22II14-10F7 TaxID=1185767 RepID=A0A1Y1SZG9_9FLAO|nr:DUF4998 domain-containing protein [Zunongwangia atlantica]ORL44140.1 PDK repeat-containing protein [Zunongwangia atlantica 22II14-10F7]
MKTIKNKLLKLLLISLVFNLLSCDTDDYPLSINSDNQSLSPIKSLELRSGNSMVLLEGFIDDPDVSEIKISWNDNAGSITVPVSTSTEIDTIQEIIRDLEERLYIFEVQSFDESGNSSKIISGGVEVYGAQFISRSTNRELSSSALLDERLEINYAPVDLSSGIIGTELIYENTSEENIEIFIDPNQNSLIIPDFKSGSSYSYRTAYVPSLTALDTVYTEYTNFTPVPIPMITFITDDSNDDEQINWLRDQGFYVSTYYNSTLSTASKEDIDMLNNADLIIIGRSGSSGDFGGDQKTYWNSLTAPLILNTQWAARSNRLNWFDNAGNPIAYTPGNDDIVNAHLPIPTDLVFNDINIMENNSIPWLHTPVNLLYLNNPTNGEILASSLPGDADNENGGAILFVRFSADTEFYDGAGESAAGIRTYFGFGSDVDGTSYYFPLTEQAKQVYLNEINRMLQ